MTDPRICLDGQLRTYPEKSINAFKPRDQFIIFPGYTYTIVAPRYAVVEPDTYRIRLYENATYEPLYRTGHKLLDGTRYEMP